MWDNLKKLFSNEEKQAEEHYRLGYKHFEDGKLEEAEEEWQKAAKLNPSLNKAWVSIADNCRVQGRLEEAVQYYEKAISAGAQSAEVYNNLGSVFSEIGKLNEALSAHQKALQLSPGNTPIVNKVAELYMKMGRETEALDLLLQAVKISPNDPTTNYLLSGFYIDRSPDVALGHLQKALPADEFRGQAKLRLALIHTRRGDIDRALNFVKEAVTEDRSILKELETRADFQKLREAKRYAEIMRRLPDAAFVFMAIAKASAGNKAAVEGEKRAILMVAMGRDLDRAKERAASELKALGWEDLQYEKTSMIAANSLRYLDGEMQKLYHQAVRKGFHCFVYEEKLE